MQVEKSWLAAQLRQGSRPMTQLWDEYGVEGQGHCVDASTLGCLAQLEMTKLSSEPWLIRNRRGIGQQVAILLADSRGGFWRIGSVFT